MDNDVHKEETQVKGGDIMRGYSTYNGYMGYVDGRYMLFASEADYEEYME